MTEKMDRTVVGKGSAALRVIGLWAALLVLAVCGIFMGSILAARLPELRSQRIVPLLFSGVIFSGSGFIACFSTFLLNALVFLTLMFLFGSAAFGVIAIPLLLFAKGVTVGLAVSSYLWDPVAGGLAKAMVLYCPAAALSFLILLIFGTQSLVFSNRLRRAAFSSSGEASDFPAFARSYVRFLCFAVVSALICAGIAAISPVFF